MPQLLDWDFAREDFGRNSEFPYFTRNEVAVLTAGIEYDDLRSYFDASCVLRPTVAVTAYFRILSTMIFFALLIRACAFGIASMACSTSGSVLISYLRLSSTLKAVL